MPPLAKGLIMAGLLLVAIGVLVWLTAHRPGFPWLGRLPGDIHLRQANGSSLHFPITSCILVSLTLSLLLALFRRLFGP